MIWEIDDGTKAIEGLDEQGRPDPAYARALGLLPAPAGRRALATTAEALVMGLLSLPGILTVLPVTLSVAAGEEQLAGMLERGELVGPIVGLSISNALVLIFAVVQLVLHGRKGTTVGKALFGIRTVNVRTLERPGFWRGAVVRGLLLWAAFLIPLLGPLLVIAISPMLDPERRGRGWLDRAAATWMVDVRRGLNPYDVKRMRIARKTQRTPEREQRAPLPSLATPVDRDAPGGYVPSTRFSGGVVGAHRAAASEPTPAAPAGADAGGGAISSFAPPADPGALVNAVPPSLARGELLDGFAPRPAAAEAAAPQPPAPAPSGPVPSASAPATPAASVSATPPPAPVTPPASAAESGADRPGGGVRAVVVLDSGERIDVRGATLFGRAPAPVAGEGAVQLIQVADDTRSVSKTHLAILPARRGVVVVDRGSTNGSAIVRDGAETPLGPGEPIALRTGDVVRFGDRTMTVERA